MKKSNYTYFYDINEEYVGYSYLSNSYASFPIKDKINVNNILLNPNHILTNKDAQIYRELCKKKFLINDSFNEYKYMLYLHNQFVYRTDWLALTIMPTMACNLRCTYCYELHTNLNNSKMSREVIENIKSYIKSRIPGLKILIISWFGGEPLMCMDVVEEISEFCMNISRENNFSYQADMTTNAVLLNIKNAATLTRLGINRLHVTIDGWKDNHDTMRVTKTGGPTFNNIFNNITNFLNEDENNNILLRVHIKDTMVEEDLDKILETLNLFDIELRNKIMVYPHVLFGADTSNWTSTCSTECKLFNKNDEAFSININNEDTLRTLTNNIASEAVKMGFAVSNLGIDRFYGNCDGDGDWSWTIRPDGYLTKCTVAVEKQRAQAKLTDNGIEVFPERFLRMRSKEYSSKLREHCSNCKYLPFCWGGCAYKHYQSPDIDTFIKEGCYKNKNTWIMDRRINAYKNAYINKRMKDEGR